MKKLLVIPFLIFYFHSICQKNTELPHFSAKLDSISVLDTMKTKSSNELFIYQKAYVTYELSNPFEVDLKWLPGISAPKTNTTGIKLQIETFSDSLKKYIPLNINDEILVSPREIKIEILKSHMDLKRKEQMYFYTQSGRKNRFRLIFKLSQFNKDIDDCYSKWIELPTSAHLK